MNKDQSDFWLEIIRLSLSAMPGTIVSIGTLIATVVLAWRQSNFHRQVMQGQDKIESKVNGNLSTLIAAKTTKDDTRNETQEC